MGAQAGHMAVTGKGGMDPSMDMLAQPGGGGYSPFKADRSFIPKKKKSSPP